LLGPKEESWKLRQKGATTAQRGSSQVKLFIRDEHKKSSVRRRERRVCEEDKRADEGTALLREPWRGKKEATGCREG